VSSGRRLLLLRHAKASTVESGHTGESGDHARDLSDRGRHDACAMGRELARQSLRPDLALVSSARRTKRTWELLGLSADPAPSVIVSDRLYLAGPSELLSMLREVPDDVGTAMLVGHNPGLHALAIRLGGAQAPASLRAGLGTCTLVVLAFECGWQALDQAGADDGSSDGLRVLDVIRP
jgi:phosphohistidine phosphatase